MGMNRDFAFAIEKGFAGTAIMGAELSAAAFSDGTL